LWGSLAHLKREIFKGGYKRVATVRLGERHCLKREKRFLNANYFDIDFS
jgi:hypothetical protein